MRREPERDDRAPHPRGGGRVTRLLYVEPDERAVEVLKRCRLWQSQIAERGQSLLGRQRDALESLAARELAPVEWTEPEWINPHSPYALLIAMRNPRALVTAEALLREGLAGTSGRYVGLQLWEQLCSIAYAGELGACLPSARRAGYAKARVIDWGEEDPAWRDETRDSGTSYGSPGAHVWRCADQINGGPPWVEALYRTGLGLWCWADTYGAPEWALIARDGDGLPWPRLTK